MITDLAGVQLIESVHMVEWFRKPRSKRRRIRYKWMKQPTNWRPMKDFIWLEEGIIVGHPATIRTLKKQLASNECSF